MNPCPVLDEHSGTIFLFFIAVLGHTPEAVQIATGKNAARLCCVTSCDAGLTWGSVRDLTEEAIGAALQGRWHLVWDGLEVWGGGMGRVGTGQGKMGVASRGLWACPLQRSTNHLEIFTLLLPIPSFLPYITHELCPPNVVSRTVWHFPSTFSTRPIGVDRAGNLSPPEALLVLVGREEDWGS